MSELFRLRTGGRKASLSCPGPNRDLQKIAEQKDVNDEKKRQALRNLAHIATDADDFRRLADALGLDINLLRDERTS